jgi:hypothetical protein
MPPSADGPAPVRQPPVGEKEAPPAGKNPPASASSAAAQVRAQLSPDFPPEALAWVDQARWEGPVDVPLAQIDFARADTWSASDNEAKVAKFTRKIGAGKTKPLVLVRRPGSAKLMVADGHHRALAYRELGRDAPAYVATVAQTSGPWDTMHAAQKKAPGRASSGPQDRGVPVPGLGSPAGASSTPRATPTHRKPRAPAYEAAGGLLGA